MNSTHKDELPALSDVRCDTVLLDAEREGDVEKAAEILRGGGLVAFPTETVYGLGGNALDAAASRKIYAAKGRPSDNPLIVHLAWPDEAARFAVTDDRWKRLADAFMPGPLTVILPKRHDNGGDTLYGYSCTVPDETTGGLDTVALRVPSHPAAHRLIEACGLPVAAPSANLSGRPSPSKTEHVVQDLYGRIDAILSGGECDIGVESTIVSLKPDGCTLLRPGGVTFEQLREILPDLTLGPGLTSKFEGRPEAPGMKYRHYAPRAQVILLDGGDEAVYAYLADKTDCGVLCYEEDAGLLARPNAWAIGKRDDPMTQAHRLFDLLRGFDETPLPVIYARLPSREGVGLAVCNRLMKAAGYEIVTL